MHNARPRSVPFLAAAMAGGLFVLFGLYLHSKLRIIERDPEMHRPVATEEALAAHCEEIVGEPRIVEAGERILVAVGYDLANIILIRTDDGNVIVDAGMSVGRAAAAKEALLARSPGPIRALIYTHSHIDHIGGAAAFVEEGTEIWATKTFDDHFIKQYGMLREIETIRGARQFGSSVEFTSLPCSALGRRVDLDGSMRPGIRFPTHRFEGKTSFTIGGLEIQLFEAHGETHDQLFVYIPSLEALFPGDNYYLAFPNLYTIRGTSPRDVPRWIQSLDRMRRLDPARLIPSHTLPIEGRGEVRLALRDYRDGIQSIQDQVIRYANQGLDLDAIVERLALPKALAERRSLLELYGQIDWSGRAIFGNALGWFDGRPEALYPSGRVEFAKKTVKNLGGQARVLDLAEESRSEGDVRYALELLALLRDADALDERGKNAFVSALRELAETIANTNGRAYLLEMALELEGTHKLPPTPELDETMLRAIPPSTILEVMKSRLLPERAADVEESIAIEFIDTGARYQLAIRHGILEIAEGDPLPGSRPPEAIMRVSEREFQELGLGQKSPAALLAAGRLQIEGDALMLRRFFQRFRRGL